MGLKNVYCMMELHTFKGVCSIWKVSNDCQIFFLIANTPFRVISSNLMDFKDYLYICSK